MQFVFEFRPPSARIQYFLECSAFCTFQVRCLVMTDYIVAHDHVGWIGWCLVPTVEISPMIESIGWNGEIFRRGIVFE